MDQRKNMQLTTPHEQDKNKTTSNDKLRPPPKTALFGLHVKITFELFAGTVLPLHLLTIVRCHATCDKHLKTDKNEICFARDTCFLTGNLFVIHLKKSLKFPTAELISQSMDVTSLIGEFGRWQAFFLGWSSYRGLLTAFNAFAYVFYVTDTDHWCARPAEYQEMSVDVWRNLSSPLSPKTGLPDRCHVYDSFVGNTSLPEKYNGSIVECTAWEYNTTVFGSTLTNEWNLVCNNRWSRSLLQSSYMFFLLVSVILLGILSDKFGRRLILIISAVILSVSGLLSLASPEYYFFLITRLGIGFGVSGLQVASYCLLAEVIGPKQRIALQIAFSFGWTFGMLVLAGMMYLLRNWWHCQLVVSIASIPLLLTTPLLYESPRWLLSTGRKKEAFLTIQKIAKFNGLPTEDLKSDVDALLKKKETENIKQDKLSMIGLFRSPLLRRNAVIVVLGSFLQGFVYFGVIKTTTTIGKNPYVHFAIAASLETVGYTLNLFITKFSKRRPAVILAYISFGIFVTATALTPTDLTKIRAGLMFVGQTCFTLAYTTKFIYDNEFFPTVARSSGIGLCMTVARLGATLEPWVREVIFYNNKTALLITYSVMIMSYSFLFILLPETFMNVLPDTMKEGEDFCKKRGPIKLNILKSKKEETNQNTVI